MSHYRVDELGQRNGDKRIRFSCPILLPSLHLAARLGLKSTRNVNQRVRPYRMKPGKDKSKQDRAGREEIARVVSVFDGRVLLTAAGFEMKPVFRFQPRVFD